MAEKIKVEGIKLSNELVNVKLIDLPDSEQSVSKLCRILAANEINIQFMSMRRMGEGKYLSFCVAAEDGPRVEALIDSDTAFAKKREFRPAVGLLSLFPHQSSLNILSLSLKAFSRAKLPLHGLGSSLSALTFITDFARLDEAVATLQEHLVFPQDFSPFRPEIQVKQSHVVEPQ